MNDRIRELEQQCWDYRINGVLIDGHLHFDAEKFTKLIIQECIEVMRKQERLPEGFFYAKDANAHEIAIREHFNITE